MLKLAGHDGTIEEMQELVEKGVDVNKMKFGCTPLQRAAAMDRGENLLWLIDNKAEVNIQTERVGNRASLTTPEIRPTPRHSTVQSTVHHPTPTTVVQVHRSHVCRCKRPRRHCHPPPGRRGRPEPQGLPGAYMYWVWGMDSRCACWSSMGNTA